MPEFRPIEFDPNLAHELDFRHGSRDTVPPARNVWDFYRGLSKKARRACIWTKAMYFPTLKPKEFRVSQLPRSSETLSCMWPESVAEFKLDRTLGIDFEEIPKWAALDAVPNTYEMSVYDQHKVLPDLIDAHGKAMFNSGKALAIQIGPGEVAVRCSHMPIADASAREANRILGKHAENNFWIPGHGFESGALSHKAFTAAGELVHCAYYPVPQE